MLPEPILTVSTRVSRYQVQSKTSLHLTSSLPRAWHLPFCPKNECTGFRVHGGENNAFSSMRASMGGSPFIQVWGTHRGGESYSKRKGEQKKKADDGMTMR